MLTVRRVQFDDLEGLLLLYLNLHEDEILPPSPERNALWQSILDDENYHILIGLANDRIVTSVTIAIIKNLTRGMRPYALIENVVTQPENRGRGYATELLGAAADLAGAAGCYKVILLTGSKKEETLRFYERAGFNRRDKTGFIRWL